MKTVTQILSLEVTTDVNPSDRSGVEAGVTAGMIAVVTAGALVE